MKTNWLKYCTISVLAGAISCTVMAENEDLNSPQVSKVDEYTLKGPKHYFTGYEPGDAAGNINVVVEIPKGSTGKWEVDIENGNLVWEQKKGKPRVVTYKGGYPANYGSIPQTAMPQSFGGDGEALDVIVLGDAIPRGEVVQVRPVGVLNLLEGEEFDAKILAVRKGSPEDAAGDLEAINAKTGAIDQVREWFTNYKGPDAGLSIKSVDGADTAMEIVTLSAESYANK